jgi:hypothetical protein
MHCVLCKRGTHPATSIDTRQQLITLQTLPFHYLFFFSLYTSLNFSNQWQLLRATLTLEYSPHTQEGSRWDMANSHAAQTQQEHSQSPNKATAHTVLSQQGLQPPAPSMSCDTAQGHEDQQHTPRFVLCRCSFSCWSTQDARLVHSTPTGGTVNMQQHTRPYTNSVAHCYYYYTAQTLLML